MMQTRVVTTSLNCYYSEIVNHLGQRQKVVYDEIKKHNNITNTELAQALGFPINVVTPRVYELRTKSLVIEACERKCGVTGRTAKAWCVKREPKQAKLL